MDGWMDVCVCVCVCVVVCRTPHAKESAVGALLRRLRQINKQTMQERGVFVIIIPDRSVAAIIGQRGNTINELWYRHMRQREGDAPIHPSVCVCVCVLGCVCVCGVGVCAARTPSARFTSARTRSAG